jgi:YD repeat-containing protein
MLRRSILGRARVLVLVGISLAVAAIFGASPAASLTQGTRSAQHAAGVRSGLTPIGRGAAPGAEGRLIEKYTTANSDTYELPNGHMLTHVYPEPVNYRDAAGRWHPLSTAQISTQTTTGPAAQSGLGSPLASPTLSPDAERNPLGQENEAACTLTSTAPTTSACNELTFKAGYETSSKSTRRALIQFVLPDLHEELILLNAQLELYAAKTTTTTSAAMGAYRVTTPWTTKATWNTSNGSTAWHTPGGDYANPEKESDAAINSAVGAKTGWTYWYPTRMVQEWYNGTDAPSGQGQPDLGFLLKDVSEGATNNVITFDGREERERNPGLTLEWVQRGVGNATNYTQLPIQLSSTQSLDVNPASGNLSIHSNDLQIASKGVEFDSARSWNSLDNEAPDYGYGWVDSNARYVQVASSGNVAFTDSSGNTFPFIKEGSAFKTPTGIEATMCGAGSPSPCPTSLPSGTSYQLIYTNTGERINFGHKESVSSFVYYYVVSAEDSAGEKQTAQYTGAMEYPTSWIDTEKTEIAYTESEATGYTKITAKTEPARSTSYVEPEGEDGLYHLTEYTNEHKEKTIYRYGGESYLEGNLLTEITEPSGNITKLSYNSNYQITKIERIPSGQKTGPTTTYTYYELGKAPAPCTSTQKATVVAETGGSEAPTLTYCSNVLDEVEQVYGYPQTGQPGWYTLEGEADSETETASVNLASGNLMFKSEDVTPSAETQNMIFDRFYNAQAMPLSSTLSPRWQWGAGPSVYLVDEGATVILHGPSGYAVALKRASTTTYTAPEEFEGTLTKNSNGTYTLTNEDNPTYQFNTAGAMTSETTEAGNTFTVSDTTLSGKSVLHSLSPSTGKALELTYDSTPHVTQTTDPASHIRKYGYNAQKQLSSYTAPSGAKTEYGYDTNNYLNKITTPEGTVETITTVAGKVTEVSTTPQGGTASGEKFTYETPTGPTCNPATDTEETVVTSEPSGELQTYCFNALGQSTTPKTEAEEEAEGIGTPPEVPAGTCYESPEFTTEECGQEDPPPENSEGGELHAQTSTPEQPEANAAPAAIAPPTVDYGISDNNRLLPYEGRPHFDYFTEPTFQNLHVVNLRRIIPWNMVYEAERAVLPKESEAAKLARKEALGLLPDVEEWVKQVTALSGGRGQPMISFDHCAGVWINPENSAQEPCSVPPKVGAYRTAVEDFLKRPVLNAVKHFTAWNEPNNEGLNPLNKSEHVEPTWNEPDLAGRYWRVLDYRCEPKVSNCQVAAGDFLDSSMRNAYNKEVYVRKDKKYESNKGYQYFQSYLHGMGHPPTAYRWSWHAYQDGKENQEGKLRGHPKHWWPYFHNFLKAVSRATEKGKHKPDIWLSEQGVIYSFGTNDVKKAAQSQGVADETMNSFVNRGGYQLTRQSGQITKFYYYSMRGARENEGSFDSGLLEAAGSPYKKPVSSPRSIYPIYARKTPTGP